jgi:uncharacterized protein
MAEYAHLAMFPLSLVLFPGATLRLHVFEPRYQLLTRHCLEDDGRFGIVLISRGHEVGGEDERHGVGTVANIESAAPLGEGRWLLSVIGAERVEIEQWLAPDPYPVAVTHQLADDPFIGDVAAIDDAWALVRRTRALASELGAGPALAPDAEPGRTPEDRVWRACAESPIAIFDRQRLLETQSADARLALLTQVTGEMATDLSRLMAES